MYNIYVRVHIINIMFTMMKERFVFVLWAGLLLAVCGCVGNGSGRGNADDSTSVVADSVSAEDTALVVSDVESEEEKLMKSAFSGYYDCSRSHDQYVFYDDHTGYFRPAGGGYKGDFKWKKSGRVVTVNYEGTDPMVGGKTRLRYDAKRHTLTEQSEMLGTLVFRKQE